MSASDRPGQAAAAIEALGESPSPSDARRELAEFDAKDLAAALVSRGGGGGGASPVVSCVLAREADITVTDVANYDVEWDKLYDNLWDLTELGAIPAGLGLDFDFDGSSSLVVPTESGVWSLSYFGTRDIDKDWCGTFRLGIGISMPWVQPLAFTGEIAGAQPVLSGVFTGALPTGTQITHQVATEHAGFGPTKVTQVFLSIVRHA